MHTFHEAGKQPWGFANTTWGVVLKKPAALKTCLTGVLSPVACIQLWFLRSRIIILLDLPDSCFLSLFSLAPEEAKNDGEKNVVPDSSVFCQNINILDRAMQMSLSIWVTTVYFPSGELW